MNCDDEEDCAAGSGSGPSQIVPYDVDRYAPDPPGNEDSEELSYPKGTDSSKCMQNMVDWVVNATNLPSLSLLHVFFILT